MSILAVHSGGQPATRYVRVYVPLPTLVVAWQFLRTNGRRGCEQLCFLAGRPVAAPDGISAQVTACILPLTVAGPGHVVLTSYQQTALILDQLEQREEVPLLSIHTHPGGSDGLAHSPTDDHGVALGPEDGVFSAVVGHYALEAQPARFPRDCAVYERVEGSWHQLPPAERDVRIILHSDTLRIVPRQQRKDTP